MKDILNFIEYSLQTYSPQKSTQLIYLLQKNKGIKITDKTIRVYIKKLREHGVPIIASNKGYSYAKTQNELNEYITKRDFEVKSETQIIDTLSYIYISKE